MKMVAQGPIEQLVSKYLIERHQNLVNINSCSLIKASDVCGSGDDPISMLRQEKF